MRPLFRSNARIHLVLRPERHEILKQINQQSFGDYPRLRHLLIGGEPNEGFVVEVGDSYGRRLPTGIIDVTSEGAASREKSHGAKKVKSGEAQKTWDQRLLRQRTFGRDATRPYHLEAAVVLTMKELIWSLVTSETRVASFTVR